MPGYDNLKWNAGLLLSLLAEENSRTDILHDYAPPHHPITQTNTPTWTLLPSGLKVLTLAAVSSQYLQSPAGAGVADLDFTAGNFSVGLWINFTSISASDMICCLGAPPTDGWDFYITEDAPNGNTLTMRLHNGASNTAFNSYNYPTATWMFIVAVRSGTIGNIYRNGVNKTNVTNALVNPVSVAGGHKFLVGIQDGEIANQLDAMMWGLRVWNRAVTPEEVFGIFQMERWLFGV